MRQSQVRPAPARRRSSALAAALVASLATGSLALGAGDASAADPDDVLRVVPKLADLQGPRGLAIGAPRNVLYTEADGTITETVLRGKGAGTTTIGAVEPGFIAPAISRVDRRHGHVLTPEGEPGTAANTLYSWNLDGEIEVVADIAAYQADDPDPYNQEGEPTQTNPYGMASLPDGSALVADAGNNDLLRVSPEGDVETVARVKPRTVLVSEELGELPDMPPPGTPIPAEAVITSVTVGADGAYYIGELRGFPATPGTSQVWRVEPDAMDAVCDPEKPDEGDCTRYADGFTSIVDLGAGPDGEIYVVELVTQSWLLWELGEADPVGALFRIHTGGDVEELAAGRLVLPGAVDVTPKGRPFVATPVFEEGDIVRVR